MESDANGIAGLDGIEGKICENWVEELVIMCAHAYSQYQPDLEFQRVL
jgi:hypothetical protein